MTSKITWADVYKDFRSRYPRLKKKAVHYRPHNYLTILLIFDDGKKMLYDYMTHTGTFM
jgi:hypothetical protein